MSKKDSPKIFNGIVKAKKKGFDGVKLRKEGEEFSFTGVLGRWMEVVKEHPLKPKQSK